MNLEKQFLGKQALVVGGTSGCGKEIALMLCDLGADVCVIGRREFSSDSHQIQSIVLDLEQKRLASLEDERVKELLGQTDILVFCYGPFVRKTLEETTAGDWQDMALLDYALPGAFVSAALNHQTKNKWGRILLFGGTRTDSVKAYKSNAAYAGAKTGLSVLVKSVASQYAQLGITCNAILPGFTHDAPPQTQDVSEKIIAKNAMNLLLTPELNGVLLNIDRGWTPGF